MPHRNNFIIADCLEGGLYIGVAGIAYMMWYVSTKFPEFKLKETARYEEVSIYTIKQNTTVKNFSNLAIISYQKLCRL